MPGRVALALALASVAPSHGEFEMTLFSDCQPFGMCCNLLGTQRFGGDACELVKPELQSRLGCPIGNCNIFTTVYAGSDGKVCSKGGITYEGCEAAPATCVAPDKCTPMPPIGHPKTTFSYMLAPKMALWEIIAIAAGAAIVFVSALCAVVLICRKKKKKAAQLKTLKAKEVTFEQSVGVDLPGAAGESQPARQTELAPGGGVA